MNKNLYTNSFFLIFSLLPYFEKIKAYEIMLLYVFVSLLTFERQNKSL
jgi:hypothetical protein